MESGEAAGSASPPDLPNSGEDAGEMQNFVQRHLVSFLTPISEHVREVQLQVLRLGEDLLRKSAMIDRNRERLDGVETQFADVAALASEAEKKLSKIQHDSTKPAENMVKALQEEINGNLQQLSNSMAATESKVSNLEKLEAELHRKLADVEALSEEGARRSRSLSHTITDLDGKFAELKHCHLGMSTRLEDTKQKTQIMSETLTKLSAVVSHQGEEASVGMTRLNKRVQGFDSKVDRYHAECAEVATKFQVVKDDVIHLFKQLGAVETGLEEVANAPKEDPTKDAKDLVDKVEKEVEQLGLSLKDWRTALTNVMNRCETNDAGLRAITKRLDESIEKQLSDLAAGARAQQSQIERAEGNILELHTNSQVLNDRASAAEERLTKQEGAHQRLSDLTAAIRTEVEGLTAFQSDTLAQLATHSATLDDASNHLAQHDHRHNGADDNIRSLRNTLEAMDAALARESGRLDLAHEYIQGVGKGLQDARKRADVGDDGLLPRKPGTLVPTLPDIPQPRRLQLADASQPACTKAA